ncbi:hypothetical protein [Streptomyces sp. NPDC127066]|uniref:hypothetical protein n=1 Tax=Streptomyces sp. NPDC127066 TaxID=3347125 RepID=UPI003654B5BC
MDILLALVQLAVRFFLAADVVWPTLTGAARWTVEKAAGTAVEAVVNSRVEAWLRRRQEQQARSENNR